MTTSLLSNEYQTDSFQLADWMGALDENKKNVKFSNMFHKIHNHIHFQMKYYLFIYQFQH